MTNLNRFLLGTAGVLALGLTQAKAVPIPLNAPGGIYNTGVDASGTPLADGSLDTHYTITSSPDGTSTETAKTSASGFPIGPWLGDDSASDWIGETAGYPQLNEGVGTFDNVTTFTSPVAGTITITGQWATDNEAPDILINGVATGNGNNNEFSVWTPFTATAAVVAGVNTLDFQNHNDGGPGGVRAEIFTANVTPIPEPASLSLLGLGGVSLLARRRRA